MPVTPYYDFEHFMNEWNMNHIDDPTREEVWRAAQDAMRGRIKRSIDMNYMEGDDYARIMDEVETR